MEYFFPSLHAYYEHQLMYGSVDHEEHEHSVLANEMNEVYGQDRNLLHLQQIARERTARILEDQKLVIVDF
jgi:hypothetical protein